MAGAVHGSRAQSRHTAILVTALLVGCAPAGPAEPAAAGPSPQKGAALLGRMADLVSDYRLGDRRAVERSLGIRIGQAEPTVHGRSLAPVKGWPASDPHDGYSVERRETPRGAPDITIRLDLSLDGAPCIRLRNVASALVVDRAGQHWTLAVGWFGVGGQPLQPRVTASGRGGEIWLDFAELVDGCASRGRLQGV